MKIAYISCDRGVPVFGTKGASIHLQELVGALSALGHQVTVLAAARGETAGALGARVIIVKVQEHAAAVPSPTMPTGKQPGLLGKELRALRLSTAVGGRLRDLVACEGCDLIYERYSLWSTAGVRCARELGIPCLVEVNAPLIQEQQRYRGLVLPSVAEAIEREVFQNADGLLAVSDALRAYTLSRGANPERTWVFPNAVDTTHFASTGPVERVPIATEKFVIGFSGSLKSWHGIEVLLDAFCQLVHRSSDYHLLVVGDGPLRNWIETYVQEHQLQEQVTLTGALPHDKVPGLLRRMHVTVAPYPYLEDFYFSPLKLFEYMAVGRPIVASRIGQIQQVIHDGVTGLLVEPGDPAGLVEAIERLRCDPALREALGVAASHTVQQHTWTETATRVTAIANQLPRTRQANGMVGPWNLASEG